LPKGSRQPRMRYNGRVGCFRCRGIFERNLIHRRKEGYGLLAIIATVGCSTANESKPSAAMTANSAPSAQSRSGGQKSPAVADRNLPSGQDKSSLDALRRGDVATTPVGSALKDVYFEFDSYDLSADARTTLKSAADWLKKNPALRVEFEGHTDERGTNEYRVFCISSGVISHDFRSAQACK